MRGGRSERYEERRLARGTLAAKAPSWSDATAAAVLQVLEDASEMATGSKKLAKKKVARMLASAEAGMMPATGKPKTNCRTISTSSQARASTTAAMNAVFTLRAIIATVGGMRVLIIAESGRSLSLLRRRGRPSRPTARREDSHQRQRNTQPRTKGPREEQMIEASSLVEMTAWRRRPSAP